MKVAELWNDLILCATYCPVFWIHLGLCIVIKYTESVCIQYHNHG